MNPHQEDFELERTSARHAVLSFVIVLVILAIAAGVGAFLYVNRVQTKQQDTPRPIALVDVTPLVLSPHTVRITSEGVVQSRREVALAAEVAGRVVAISPQLVAGGHVKEGDELAVVDDADYLVALRRAKSDVAEAELAIEQEMARSAQAKKDWEKLGRGEAPALVLRKPQIAAAEARLSSAQAEVERALRDIRRTHITAPFSGRVRHAMIEAGAYLTPGTKVAEIFSDEEVEVRLPFSLADFGQFLGKDTPPFAVKAMIGGSEVTWQAQIDRTEGEIDRGTLSGYAIARIHANEEGRYPPVGLFVSAELSGTTLEDVAEIPRSSLRGIKDVWVLQDGRLDQRTVEVLSSGRDSLVVTGDFQPGDLLVTTRLSTPVPGTEMKARIKGENP